MNCYDLGGHSGCKILLMEDDDGLTFVRKISKDKEYNNRLKKQCEKQASFNGGKIKAPTVYNSGLSEEGLFYFDMEYVQGMTLAEYVKTMEIGKVRGLVETLVDNLIPKQKKEISEEDRNIVRDIFNCKISNLRQTLLSNKNSIVEQSLDLLEAHDWTSLIPSQCHGDLTLENIIIKNDTLYFIDFLDSFYDSWLIDIGTLLQDVQIMWSYRNNTNIGMNTVLRLIVFRDLLLDEIKKIDSGYVLEIYYILLQKMIRIYPYVKDEETYNFLNEKTTIVLKTINRLEQEEL